MKYLACSLNSEGKLLTANISPACDSADDAAKWAETQMKNKSGLDRIGIFKQVEIVERQPTPIVRTKVPDLAVVGEAQTEEPNTEKLQSREEFPVPSQPFAKAAIF